MSVTENIGGISNAIINNRPVDDPGFSNNRNDNWFNHHRGGDNQRSYNDHNNNWVNHHRFYNYPIGMIDLIVNRSGNIEHNYNLSGNNDRVDNMSANRWEADRQRYLSQERIVAEDSTNNVAEIIDSPYFDSFDKSFNNERGRMTGKTVRFTTPPGSHCESCSHQQSKSLQELLDNLKKLEYEMVKMQREKKKLLKQIKNHTNN